VHGSDPGLLPGGSRTARAGGAQAWPMPADSPVPASAGLTGRSGLRESTPVRPASCLPASLPLSGSGNAAPSGNRFRLQRHLPEAASQASTAV
jgi:hypothetical protein